MGRLLPFAVAGGTVGAILALLTPSGLFARIVPWLILAASLAIAGRPQPRDRRRPDGPDRRSLRLTVGTIAIYGGYFGAAAGVMLLAGFLLATTETVARANAAKNLLLGASNLAATVIFAAFGPLRWSSAVPLAAGCLIGSRFGPPVVRRLPERPLRLGIGILGLGLAVVLGIRAYCGP